MTKQVFTNLDMVSASKVINLPAPTDAADAATKGYVDSAVEGLAWKDSARVATQSNLNLASPGATIDSITMATNDRVLVRNQSDLSENGIYIFNGSATPMTRTADTSTADELEQAVVTVEEGTDEGATFRQTAVNFTLDTDDVVFAAFGSSAPTASETTAGIIEIATQGETDTGTDDARAITPDKLANWSGAPKRYAADVGDGSATSYAITHNLATRDVTVAVYRNSGNYDEVVVDVEHTNTNTVTLKFTSAPASNAYRVVVLG